MRQKRERSERFVALSKEPKWLDQLCNFIIEGRTLQEWCRKHDIRYMDCHRWLHDVDHGARLEAYTMALEGRNAYFGDIVMSGLRDIASADIRKLYGKDGKLLAPNKLPDELARVVASVKEDDKGGVDVKLESRKGGHELLGRALGLYRDRVEHEGRLTLEELVGGSSEVAGSHKDTPRSMTPGSSARDPRPNRRSSSKT